MRWKISSGLCRIIQMIAVVAVFAPDAAFSAGETRQTFRHWLAVCTGDGACEASAFVKPGIGPNGEAYALTVLRPAGPNSSWHIAFVGYGERPAEGSEISIEIDDKDPVFLLEGQEITDPNGSGKNFIVDEQALSGMLANMQAGSNYSVTFEETGKVWRTIQFSLRGVTAALNWIDTQQERPDSPRVAVAPQAQFDAPPTLESKKYTPSELPETIKKLHNASTDCKGWDAEGSPHRTSTSTQLDEDRTVFIVPCFYGGSGIVSRLYITDLSGNTNLLLFASGDSKGWHGIDMLMNATIDRRTGTLKSRAMFDTSGKCGSSGIWRWSGDLFRMKEYRHWAQCAAGRNPENWPLLYPPKS